MIQNYQEFVDTLLYAGFSMGGGNANGIYAVIPWGWQEEAPYPTPIRWHTDDPETDPWVWRMRVLDERDDIAYGKLFFNKSGFITKEWYPYFLATRRSSISFEDAYERGTISHAAKRIYDIVVGNGIVASHSIKALAGFTKEEKSAFDRAITELQMKMHITSCGKQHRFISANPNACWASVTFCTTETFWGEEIFALAAGIDRDVAFEKISEQVLKLNPEATEKKIEKFITG